MDPKLRTNVVACIVFLLTFGVYLSTMVPSITGDDSGELGGVGATLGTAHPPGYPLYSLTGKATVTLIPWGNHLYRVNIVSVLSGALTAAVLYFALALITAQGLLALALSLTFAFSKSVWAMSNVTEVYGIASFMAGLIALTMLHPSPRRFTLLAFLFGAGLTAHYTLGLLLPGILYWVFVERRRVLEEGPKRSFSFVPWACAGFSLTLFLLIRAQQDPLFGWEDPKTIERFWQVIARLRYGSLALAQGGPPDLSPSVIYGKLKFFLGDVRDNFTWIGIGLFCIGLYYCARERKRGWTFLLLLLGSGPGFLVLANVGVGPSSAALLDRFLFLSFIFIVAIMGVGARRFPLYASGAFLVLPVFLLAHHYPLLNHRHEYLFYDYAKNILRSLPENTLLFADRADEMEFALAYLHLAERRRPDILFIDCNAGVTRSIYGNRYYRIWGKPRLALREQVEKAIVERSSDTVYYATFDPGLLRIPRVQEGLVFRAKPVDAGGGRFPFQEIYALRIPGKLNPLDDRGMNMLRSYLQLMGNYCLAGDDTAAAGRFFEGLAAYDPSGRWTSSVAFLYHQKGNLASAEKFYRQAIEKGRADPLTYTNLGTVYETRGRNDEAARMYREAMSIDPDNEQAHYNMAVLYWRQSNWPEVIRELERVLEINPRRRDALAYLRMARQRTEK